MKIFKLAVISLFFMSLLIVGMSLFIPGHTRVSRAITIPFAAEKIIPAITDLRNWPQWNELILPDQVGNLQLQEGTITGKDWSLERVSQTDSTITFRWTMKDKEAVQSVFTVTPYGSEATVVQWYFDFEVNWYPWEKFGSILFDRQLGPSMERSLEKLKKNAGAPL
jgi:hypothetical protein